MLSIEHILQGLDDDQSRDFYRFGAGVVPPDPELEDQHPEPWAPAFAVVDLGELPIETKFQVDRLSLIETAANLDTLRLLPIDGFCAQHVVTKKCFNIHLSLLNDEGRRFSFKTLSSLLIGKIRIQGFETEFFLVFMEPVADNETILRENVQLCLNLALVLSRVDAPNPFTRWKVHASIRTDPKRAYTLTRVVKKDPALIFLQPVRVSFFRFSKNRLD